MSIDYPATRREDTVDVLHGVEVADPYRWLEDPDSLETKDWVSAQNRLSRSHLDALPSRPWFHETMLGIVQSPRAGTPDRVGTRYLVSRNDGSQQQDQWFVADGLAGLADGGGRLLLDPNTFSSDGTSSLASYDATEDDRLLAYQVSDGGSDWTTIRVRDVAGGEDLDDVLTKVKFSAVTWLPDGRSFLYLHFPTDGSGTGTEAGALPGGRLRRHVLGDAQDDDALVWEAPENPSLSAHPTLSHDGRWIALHLTEGTSERNRLWLLPVTTDADGSTVGEPVRAFDEADAAYEFVRTLDGPADGVVRLVLRTDLDAPRGRVVQADVATSGCEAPRLSDLLPESEDALRHVQAAGGELLVLHLVDARPRLTRWSPAGRPIGEVEVPGGALLTLHSEVDRDEVLLGTSSVVTRLASYRLALGTGELIAIEGLAPAGASWTPPEVVVDRVRATSKDGTPVPYFLVRRADLPAVAPRPTLLYGYGGFDIPMVADFRPLFAGWLSAGGVLAVANLRGGGEYGAAWHDQGRLHHKQNVFDDFAAVGDHLVATGVTTHASLGIHGGSNGGLLVGATMLQRPDLAAVALPAVGVMDMLRFHLFTIGRAWIADFGSPEDPEMFETLRAYSPLHQIRPGGDYPATLVTTGDHDDRVVPAHSFKFTATLQAAQQGTAPVLARIETSAGHGLGKPSRIVAAEAADMLAFAADITGLVPSGSTPG